MGKRKKTIAPTPNDSVQKQLIDKVVKQSRWDKVKYWFVVTVFNIVALAIALVVACVVAARLITGMVNYIHTVAASVALTDSGVVTDKASGTVFDVGMWGVQSGVVGGFISLAFVVIVVAVVFLLRRIGTLAVRNTRALQRVNDPVKTRLPRFWKHGKTTVDSVDDAGDNNE